ncbi:hypothetical protein N7541_003000 [Penicillium brevicompactum]|uniref:Protein kinase domain-containing protein n=1 Tax=Penicillium brevicompactum TaxID=5074 RepID=A0A9W9V0Z3_PENBR|nr:hypothetical protein N7541_003000 [Penicillium brevicompactum]
MANYPTLVLPTGARFIALGAAGAVFQDGNGIVNKIPIVHDLTGCDEAVITHIHHQEYISDVCITREKLIYQKLPKNPNILDCLKITEDGLHFPYHPLGDLRTYLSNHQVPQSTRCGWIKNAIDAIAFIHSHNIIHADIGPRNFLVADDLSLKLCDFAGSVIVGDDMENYVEEEDRYRLAPGSSRSFATDLFALGCLIYEISSGSPPYDELDAEKVTVLYAIQSFPSSKGLRYHNLIQNCWNSTYTTASMLQDDFLHYEHDADRDPILRPWGRHLLVPVFWTLCLGSVIFLVHQKRILK